jgi:hypothetical protein
MALLRSLVTLVAAASAMPAPQTSPSLSTRAACEGNTASDRSVWCDYSIDTNWYEEAPDTGVTVEVNILRVPSLAKAHTDDSSIGSMYRTPRRLLMVSSGWFWPSTALSLAL